MKIRDALGRVDRVQKSRGFKIGASAVVVLAALAYFLTFVVLKTGPGGPSVPLPSAPDVAQAEQVETAISQTEQAVRDILSTRTSPVRVGAMLLNALAVSLIVIWLGLSLTYVALFALAAAIAWPLSLFDSTEVYAVIVAGIALLTAAFTALLAGVRYLLGGAYPVFAVARNVLDEAVRMKVSLVFIVLLIFGLAALPTLVDDQEELRYRVQSFLQYGTGGAFWIIGILAVFFSAGTLTYEQRDKILWQTITKPVANWQYLLGKWLGVIALNAVLLAVCASAIFLFTEYLRAQPALGESSRLDPTGANVVLTEDRLILETQVLTARVSRDITPPVSIDDEDFQKTIDSYIENQRVTDPAYAKQIDGSTDPVERARVADDLYKAAMQMYRTIPPGAAIEYEFSGLGGARRNAQILTLRYRINTGSNRPDEFYKLTFGFLDPEGNVPPLDVRETALGTHHSLSVPPHVIDENGVLRVLVANGDLRTGVPNPRSVTFPPGGLEISYSAGSYYANFARVTFVLWLKLAFLSMVAIWAASFLNFPVACLVSFGVFLAAEGAGFLSESLDSYATTDMKGNLILYKAIAYWVTKPIVGFFSVYSDLKPTTRLVDGRLVSWGSVLLGTIVLAVWSAVLYGLAVYAFRRRELGIYSGS